MLGVFQSRSKGSRLNIIIIAEGAINRSSEPITSNYVKDVREHQCVHIIYHQFSLIQHLCSRSDLKPDLYSWNLNHFRIDELCNTVIFLVIFLKLLCMKAYWKQKFNCDFLSFSSDLFPWILNSNPTILFSEIWVKKNLSQFYIFL